ncbi:hypothetical protein FACS1894109_05720 [Spirochaetia bacterium]|nr:hypothetical protein FACS1894109_05720 [Spirochaetia bacterium]
MEVILPHHLNEKRLIHPFHRLCLGRDRKSKKQNNKNEVEYVKNEADIAIDGVLRGVMMNIWNIHYVSDSDQFLSVEYPRLNMIAAALKLVPSDRRFLVEGHVADVPSPSPVSNMELSMLRARRMVEALIQRGIARERFDIRGWGGTKPLGDNATEVGRRRNRRVEITVLKKGIFQ